MSLRLCQLTAKWHTEDTEKKKKNNICLQEAFVFQLLSYVWLFVTPWTAAHQASLSFTISQNLLKLMSLELVMPSNHLIQLPPSPLIFNFFQHQGLSQWVDSLPQVAKELELLLSVSVLPVNIQGWFPLGLTGLISLLSKGLSRVFSSTTVQKHQFFSAQPSVCLNSHIYTWLLEEL